MIGVFTKNTLFTLATRFLTIILGLAISVIISRTLGPVGQGVYSLAILLPAMLIIFNNFGITSSTVFYTAKRKYPLKEIFGNNIILSILIGLFSILIGLVIIFLFGEKLFPGVKQEYLILALFFIPFSLFFDFISHILIGLQEIKKFNILSFLQSSLFLILIGFALLRLHLGIKAAITAQILAFLIAGIILFYFTNSKSEGFSLKINKNYLKDTFSYGSKNYIAAIFSFLNYRINLFVINALINPVAVGFYTVAGRLSEGIWMLSLSAATVLFPRIAAEGDAKKIKEFTPFVCRNVLLVTLLIITPLFILARSLIIFLYTKEFLESVRTFQILLIGAYFVSGWRILANDLIAQGRPMLNTYVTIASVLINIALTIIWIPRWGIEGAALASTVSYLFMFVAITIIYSRVSGNRIVDIILPRRADLVFYKKIILHFKGSFRIKN